MNGWLKPAPYFCRLPRLSACPPRTWRPLFFCHRRDFTQTQTCRSPTASPTPLSNILSSSRVFAPNDPPFVRRAVLLANIPPSTSVQQLLDLVHTGALEHVRFVPSTSSTHAELSFLHGISAARFVAEPLVLRGHTLSITWLPYKPLDPVLARAVERDRARRTLLLCAGRSRVDGLTAEQLRAYLGDDAVERVTLRVVDDPRAAYREIAVVDFYDVGSAVRVCRSFFFLSFILSCHYYCYVRTTKLTPPPPGTRAHPRRPHHGARTRHVRDGPMRAPRGRAASRGRSGVHA
jgi:hypothetical protein